MPVSRLELDYEYDFLLLGIVSSSKDYTLIWHLNKNFFSQLSKSQDIQIVVKKPISAYFSVYRDLSETHDMAFVKNKSEFEPNISPAFLLPELKDYDYFVVLFGNSIHHGNDFLSKLKTVPLVTYVKNINISTLKSKEVLLYIEDTSVSTLNTNLKYHSVS